MQSVTLGGERLGSGKKMKVGMNGYERSTHDLSYIFRSTMSAGTLVPFICEVALPGDTFDINLDCHFNTHPTLGPLFGSFKIQLDVFECPIRLYQGKLHNNALGIGMTMENVFLPIYELTAQPGDGAPADLDNSQINPSAILAYLGVRGIGNPGDTPQDRQFNAVPWLAYWDIYKNYYANKQEEIGAVIHTPQIQVTNDVTSIEIVDPVLPLVTLSEEPGTSVPTPITPSKVIRVNWTVGSEPNYDTIMITLNNGVRVPLTSMADVVLVNSGSGLTVLAPKNQFPIPFAIRWGYKATNEVQQGPISVTTFDLVNLDTMRNEILSAAGSSTPVNIGSIGIQPWDLILQSNNALLSSQEGLACKTYLSDLYNNWLNTEVIDSVNEISAISTAGDEFTIDQLIMAEKVYELLNRIAVSGGTYHDWITTVYDVERIRSAETPMYMGGLIKELVFQEVVSNSGENSTETGQPLGTLAGKGVMGKQHKGGEVVIRVSEPSYIIALVSLTPRIDYSQGNKWDSGLRTLNDLHKPQMDQIGFQESINEYRAWWTTNWDTGDNVWFQTSAGKIPAWMDYMTSVNKTYGNFAIASNEMFMTLNRRYEGTVLGGPIEDLTTYIDPSKFNFIFAQTSLDSQNFWCQISVDMIARRKMSYKIMPNL